jgi:DNA invertase Pin-like site-specific DNA recombinase
MQKDKFQNLNYLNDMSETKKLSRTEKQNLALQMFSQGKTVEDIMKELKISRATALRYYSIFQNLKTNEIAPSQNLNYSNHLKLLLIFAILGVLVVISVFQYSITTQTT